ncbi:MAG: dihydrolipoamide acetyltransferase family protein [Pelagibacterium sp.]|uniref:dihydrolipoamide acetyltransferase family protein n=1 Tax=Pelagibacterium sp. TaxID=1967288 RepID=UPI0032EACDE5
MKTYSFRLPDIGEGVAEAEITAWHIKVGDHVEEDQTLVDVMTDKATIDMTSPVTGTVLKLFGAEGDKAPVGSVLVELEIEGEDAGVSTSNAAPSSPDKTADKPDDAEATSAAPPTAVIPGEDAGPSTPSADEKAPPSELTGSRLKAGMTEGAGAMEEQESHSHQILIAPATRRRAEDLDIDLNYVAGTGPEGRITDADLDAHLKSRAPQPAARERHDVHEKKIIGLRRRIAERMELSARSIPHFSYVEDCDMTALEGLRREINASRHGAQPKLTLLPFFMRALAQLLPEFPHVNAHYDADAGVLCQFEPIHIGIATQTAEGLMVPVVHHVEALDIWDCAREMSRVTNAAREGRASRDELSGSTITLTSLGALGGVAATPIINHPEVAIIGPNKLMGRPVFINNQVTVRTMMNLSSSFDHRIVDGYDAAKFIQRLKRLLENPALIFIEKRSWS